MRSGNPLGDCRQRAIMLALVFEPVFANLHSVGMSVPLTYQSRAGLHYDTGIEPRAGFVELSVQALHAPPQRVARPGIDLLLQLMGEGSDHQIATEAKRRSSAMQLAPGNPQILRRPIDQFGNLLLDLSCVSTAPSISASTRNERRLASMLASRSAVDCRVHTLVGPSMRYTRPRSSFAEAIVSPSFFFSVPEKTPRTV